MRAEMQGGFHDLKDRMVRLESTMLRVKRDVLGGEETLAFQQLDSLRPRDTWSLPPRLGFSDPSA